MRIIYKYIRSCAIGIIANIFAFMQHESYYVSNGTRRTVLVVKTTFTEERARRIAWTNLLPI